MANASAPARKHPQTLAERFWSLARGKSASGGALGKSNPVQVVDHVLAVLDALERGEVGNDLSVNTVSFLKLLREHELGGELSYASPEQIRGELMDERSLVFSVGVLLFERLTGKHPFGAEGNNPRRFARIRKGEFGSGVNHFPTVPPGLRTVLMCAMGPFREERYATLAQLRSHLEQFTAQQRPAPKLPGTTGRKRAKPSTDSMDTRIVDMSQRLQGERAVAARRDTVPLEAAAATALARSGSASITFAENERVFDRAVTKPNLVLEPIEVEPQRDISGIIELTRTPEAGDIEEQPARVPTDAMAEARVFVPDLRPRSRIAPLIWAGAGAAIASVVFFTMRPADVAKTSSSAAAVAPAATEVKAAEPTAVTDERDEDKTAAPSAAVQPAAATATFDIQLGGNNVLDAAQHCFSPNRLRRGVRFGLGVVFPSDDAKPRKLYFAANQLALSERQCMHHSLGHVSAGAAPEKTQLVNYRMWLSATDRKVDASLR